MASTKNPPRAPAPDREGDALMARIDRALAHWPEVRRDEATAGKAAAIAATASRAAPGDEGEADADLLAPPLPRAAGEGPAHGAPRRAPWMRRAAVAAAAVVAMAAGLLALRPRGDAGDPSLPPGAVAARTQGAGASAPPPAPPAVADRGEDPSFRPVAAAASAAPAPVTPPAATRRAVAAARPAGPGPAPGQDPSLASPPVDETLRPAAAVSPGAGVSGDPWNVPRRPSVGAVQGAFGAVLPAARACLGPDDPAYHAMVTFQADGTVRAVALADGDLPKMECVRAALGKASVPPFAEDSYVAPVTVRDLGR